VYRERAADQCIHLHAAHATQHRATSISVIQSLCVVCFSLRLSNGLVYYAGAAGSELSQKERRCALCLARAPPSDSLLFGSAADESKKLRPLRETGGITSIKLAYTHWISVRKWNRMRFLCLRFHLAGRKVIETTTS
jgi:hypothetical protein